MDLPILDAGRSTAEMRWLACREKHCCRGPVVVPTGADVWRIARSLGVPPTAFLRFFESREGRRDAFALDQSARRFRLMLARRPGREAPERRPCTFLLKTRSGARRCALGSARPLVCRSFAAELLEGVLVARRDPGCRCGPWTLADLDAVADRALVERRQADAARYVALVEAWNGLAVAGEPAGFERFCEFLLAAYDAEPPA